MPWSYVWNFLLSFSFPTSPLMFSGVLHFIDTCIVKLQLFLILMSSLPKLSLSNSVSMLPQPHVLVAVVGTDAIA